jgi:hypothetical protein
LASLFSVRGALQKMRGRCEPALEIVDQSRLGGHLGKARVLFHDQIFAGIVRQDVRYVVGQLAVGQVEQCRLDGDALEFVHHVLFERISTFG